MPYCLGQAGEACAASALFRAATLRGGAVDEAQRVRALCERLLRHSSVRGDAMIGGARGAGFSCCCVLSVFGSIGIVSLRHSSVRGDSMIGGGSWRRLLLLLPAL